jgi:HD-GYP domain-containing protein (c-di-GMP phosphodiesterase class II)
MQDTILLPVEQLRCGLHVHLELGWMEHPFPLSHFRIASDEQLHTLRGLGLERVRVSVQRSDEEALQALVDAGALTHEQAGLPAPGSAPADVALQPAPVESLEAIGRRQRAEALSAERACAALAERRYAETGKALKRSFELALSDAAAAREQCETQVHALLDQLLGAQDMAIRLLTEAAGDRASMHAVNVTVISLLLGKQLGLSKAEMFDLGNGAMLHDVGKIELPDRVRWIDALATGVPQHERQFYQEHVSRGVVIGRRMGLAAGAMLVIAQHHELADGSGFPLRLSSERMTAGARIVALVNRYDKLCNPVDPALAFTPHEALAQMYGQSRAKFDAAVFAAFIKMMGVYPPGSVVQLTDDRYGMVVSVNAARPLKPLVLVHDAKLPRHDAVPLDLEHMPGLGVRRSLKAQQLPRVALEYLSPRPRLAYFFEHARAAYPETPEVPA